MARIVIDIPDYMLNQIMIGCPFKLPSQFVTETYKIIRNGKILPKGQFIAICESDYPITEKVENTLKETAFVGGDEEDMYCFDIKEIIEADKEEA